MKSGSTSRGPLLPQGSVLAWDADALDELRAGVAHSGSECLTIAFVGHSCTEWPHVILAGNLAARATPSTDHGRLKARLRPMCRLQRLRSALLISTGHAGVQNLRRGNDELGVDADPQHCLPAAFTELARVI